MRRRLRIIRVGVVLGILLFGYAALGFPGVADIYIDRLNRQATPRVYTIARKLGYTDVDTLKENTFCHKTYLFTLGTCWKLVHFTTHQSLEQMQLNINALPTALGIRGNGHATPIFVDSLLSRINFGVGLFTINGQTTYTNASTPRPIAPSYQWSFDDSQDLSVIVNLWELSRSDSIYAFNGRRITNDLVTVMVQVR